MAKKTKHTPKGSSFTDLVLDIMRLRGLIQEHGQRLTAPHELSVARWPVLGAIEETPLTASQVARRMGMSRQNVQTVVKAMQSDGFVVLQDNPDHIRSPLIEITPKAVKHLKRLHADQRAWANELGAQLPLREVQDCIATLKKLGDVLESGLEQKQEK